MSPELAADIPGAPEFIEWFGHFPTFHDGSVLGFALDLSRRGRLVVKAHRMNPELDEKGYFILDKHCVVTFTLEKITEADLSFEDAPEFISQLTVAAHDDGFQLEIDAINGFDGLLRMKALRLGFEPVAKP